MDNNFNPDAYIAQNTPSFDPDAYIKANAPDEGALMAAGRGALRNFPMAQQAVAGMESGPYQENIKNLTNKAEAAKSAHPVAYGAGAVAGTAAPLAIPAVGEALEAAPIIGNAALGAIQSQSDNDLTKFNSQNAKEAATAGGIGALTGGIAKGISAVSPSTEELAGSSAAKGFGMRARGGLRGMGDDPETTWSNIGKWANEAKTSDGESLVGIAKRPGKELKAVNNILDTSGKNIGDIIDSVDPHATIDAASLTQELQPLIRTFKINSPDTVKQVEGLINEINDLSSKGELDFKALHELKGIVGDGLDSNPRMGLPYRVLSDRMNSIIASYGEFLDNPGMKAAYDAAKKDYHYSSLLLPTLKKAEGYELAQGPLGNSGLLGLFGLGAGVAAGHPIAGAASAAASAVGRPIANMLGRNVGLKAVPYIPGIAKTANKLNQGAAAELANFLGSQYNKKEQ